VAEEAIRFRFVATGSAAAARAFNEVAVAAQRMNASVGKGAVFAVAQQRRATTHYKQQTRRRLTATAELAQIVAQDQKKQAKAKDYATRQGLADERRAIRRREELAHKEVLTKQRIRNEETVAIARDNRKRDRMAERVQRRAAGRSPAARRGRRGGFRQAVEGGFMSMGARTLAYGSVAAGGLLAGGAARAILGERKEAMGWAVAGRTGGAKFGKGFGPGVSPSPEYLTARAREVAIESGVSTEDILRGGHKIQEITGDMKFSVDAMELLAQAAVGTSSDIDDVAASLATMNRMMDIDTIQQATEAFAMFTAQGKAGAIEIKDISHYLPELAAEFASMGLPTGPQGLMELGNIFQLARFGTGTPGEAKTSMRNMLRQMKLKSEFIEKEYGVQMYEGEGTNKRIRGIRKWLPELIVSAGGEDVQKKSTAIGKLLAIRGEKAPAPLMKAWQDAMNEAREKGLSDTERKSLVESRVKEAVDQFILEGTRVADFFRDFQTQAKEPTNKLTSAWEQVKQQAEGPLMEAIQKVVEALPALIPVAAAFISALADMVGTIAFFTSHLPGGKRAAARMEHAKAKIEAQIAEAEAKELEEKQTKELLSGVVTPGLAKQVAEARAKATAAAAEVERKKPAPMPEGHMQPTWDPLKMVEQAIKGEPVQPFLFEGPPMSSKDAVRAFELFGGVSGLGYAASKGGEGRVQTPGDMIPTGPVPQMGGFEFGQPPAAPAIEPPKLSATVTAGMEQQLKVAGGAAGKFADAIDTATRRIGGTSTLMGPPAAKIDD